MDIREIGILEMDGYLKNNTVAQDGLYFSAWDGHTWMCAAILNGVLQKHRSARINAALDWLNNFKTQSNANTD